MVIFFLILRSLRHEKIIWSWFLNEKPIFSGGKKIKIFIFLAFVKYVTHQKSSENVFYTPLHSGILLNFLKWWNNMKKIKNSFFSKISRFN